MGRNKKSKDGLTYAQRISALNKSPEEVERITKLFEDNINLAHNIAKKYYKTGYWEFDDSVQIARMGLWKACLIWDPNKFKLSTLATNVITRDFIDYETKQKRQPAILFNIEENCVTDDVSLGDVLVDETSETDEIVEGKSSVDYLNIKINKLLEEVADELNLPVGRVKLIYLIYIESNQYQKNIMKTIKFLPKSTIGDVILLFKEKLNKILEEENENE